MLVDQNRVAVRVGQHDAGRTLSGGVGLAVETDAGWLLRYDATLSAGADSPT